MVGHKQYMDHLIGLPGPFLAQLLAFDNGCSLLAVADGLARAAGEALFVLALGGGDDLINFKGSSQEGQEEEGGDGEARWQTQRPQSDETRPRREERRRSP